MIMRKSRKRILIVDDEPHICTILSKLFSSQYYVDTANNGEEALEHLEDNAFSLMIVDMVMPKIQGSETIVTAHIRYPKMKIIAISGADDKETYLKAARMFGATKVVTKPFKLDDFKTIVSDVLEPN